MITYPLDEVLFVTLVGLLCRAEDFEEIELIGREQFSWSRRFLPVEDGLPQALLEARRSHWSIENNLHWQLDVTFREDACRIGKDHAPFNLAIIRHAAFNILESDNTICR